MMRGDLKMNINLKTTPFMRAGSYLVISYIDKDYWVFRDRDSLQEGMYIRSVHGDCRSNPLVGRIVPTVNGDPVPYTYSAEPGLLTMFAGDGRIEVTYADQDTILFRGKGENIGVRLEGFSEGSAYSYCYEIPTGDGETCVVANVFKNASNFFILSQQGGLDIEQKWDGMTSSESGVHFRAVKGQFIGSMEEVKIEKEIKPRHDDFDSCVTAVQTEFRNHVACFPDLPKEYDDLKEGAAYLNWGLRVSAQGLYKREACYASKNWMSTLFSWDHCFAAFPLADKAPKLAWDQYRIIFDFQDETGRLPDCVTDTYVSWNFCKQPFHGYALKKLMEHMDVTDEQLADIYGKLAKQSEWWMNYRDTDHDGFYEYRHGNCSAWDNNTAFKDGAAVESPDLMAFMILQSEMLQEIAERLHMEEEAAFWKKTRDEQLSVLLEQGFVNDLPVARMNGSNTVIECNTLLPYECIILGNRLPDSIIKAMVKSLRENFLEEYGLATEMTSSELYVSDSYWRGPVWAPPMYLIADGLKQVGEEELAKELAARYIKAVRKSGFAENFDAVTGEGYRDKAYEWSASTCIILVRDFLSEG